MKPSSESERLQQLKAMTDDQLVLLALKRILYRMPVRWEWTEGKVYAFTKREDIVAWIDKYVDNASGSVPVSELGVPTRKELEQLALTDSTSPATATERTKPKMAMSRSLLVEELIATLRRAKSLRETVRVIVHHNDDFDMLNFLRVLVNRLTGSDQHSSNIEELFTILDEYLIEHISKSVIAFEQKSQSGTDRRYLRIESDVPTKYFIEE